MNMQQLMQQAQKMQKQMKENTAKMENTDFDGISGNGKVKIVINGLYDMKSVTISPELVNNVDVELLQDLIVVAFNDAKNKVDSTNKNTLGSAFGGLLGGNVTN
jgi:DNA-binding YbaB/EbfC family protein